MMAVPVYSPEEYFQKMLAVPRLCAKDVLAYYEHRVGGICTDAAYMLAPLDDHIVHRADGVFETVKYADGRLYQLDAHLDRMRRSCDAIFLAPPCPWEFLREIILAVSAAGKEADGLMRILLGRGPGGFGIDPYECPEPSLYIVAYRYPPQTEDWFAAGLKGFRTSIPPKHPALARIKITNYVSNMLMVREAHVRGADTPFCFDDGNFLTESAVANLCIVDDSGTLAVPDTPQALPGTMLRRALELLKGTIPIVFRRIAEEEIFTAREVLLFGTGPDCVAVTSYEGKPINVGVEGPVAKKARTLIREDIRTTGVPVPGLMRE